MTTVQDNPQVPSISNTVYNPDQLIAGQFPLVTKGDAVVVSGAGALKRGTVLGQITVGTGTSAVKASGANTGTGTCVMDVTTPVRANARAGLYTVRCIEAVVNGGKFQVIDPIGVDLGTVIIPAGAGASVTFDDRIKFVLTDAGIDFIVGDGFDITVAAGSGKFITSIATAVDGSQNPVCILVDDVDATAGDKNCGVYLTGMFNKRALTFDGSWTTATLEPLLRALSIFLRNSVSNATPT